MSDTQTPKLLSRYTSVGVLYDLLQNERIELTDPARWQDKNDSEVLDRYRELRGFPHVRALCLSQQSETIHHWNTFASGTDGCCISFRLQSFLEAIDDISGIRHGQVNYFIRSDLKSKLPINTDDMPFIKRHPYRDECEYRLIWEGKLEPDWASKFIPIPRSVITEIKLNQNMPGAEVARIRNMVKDLTSGNGGKHIRVNQSKLYRFKPWLTLFGVT